MNKRGMLAYSINYLFALLICLVSFQSCNRKQNNVPARDSLSIQSSHDSLPAPYATKSVKNYSKVVGWPAGKLPQAPTGFQVIKFADGLQNPRWIYVTPNGDILVSEANTETKGLKKVAEKISGKAESQNTGESANRITLLRDKDNDGKPELKQVLLFGLTQPFGMLVLGNSLYVANTDGLVQYPYQAGQTQIKSEGKKILELPAGGYNNHWTRNIIANQTQTKIYISVGSGSNIGEHGMENEIRRANILEVNPDGTGERVFASGLRNPVGMGISPGTNELWTVVNERDELGDDLVPDFLTKVKEGGFYGWPYAYFGPNEDPRLRGQKPELVKQTLKPDVSLGAHTASLGFVFYNKNSFPAKYHGGAFIGQHGSWNRSQLSGYKVVFVPFKNGKPSGPPEDFLTGFIADAAKSEVYGRPVGIAVLPDGAMLVADDASGIIWKIVQGDH
ncbi:sorbosone dehydrogenase family protein [Chryseolinea sp. H1M3-3]|uniref:PQQ-dependent sugar dehydrogenase n=1 Tax=Chryseolinea sp. H1M3-3 TaxID=3034144 RepID=UPI0023ECB0F7|nr:sorbosone dehydrogenase family protein [Chryseolinea sp. H1M3-3]